ncbi:MAG: hypothetical protein U9O94_10535, partial [Nanoarchaeota archaeon]|nr:hypothetical protein [Nanoarchaeota archaeon]MEA2037923.1 hypothetical protein [Nanoarchaeota archaeon]
MSWFSVVGDVLGAVVAPVTKWVEGNEERKTLLVEQEDKQLERQHQINLRKIDVAQELAKQGQKIEADWDTNAQNNMKHTWKDEWFVILFSIPLIGAFVPALQEAVLQGFNVLEQTPEWYRWLLAGIVVATFGLRWMFSKIKFGK